MPVFEYADRAAGSRTLLTSALQKRIAAAELLSFDVFDTLVTRPLLRPEAVFELVGIRAAPLLAPFCALTPPVFRGLRSEAAQRARLKAQKAGSEEYDLQSVYEHLCAELSAPHTLASTLKALEEECELTLLSPRMSGQALFRYAQSLGKRVVLISDSYLEFGVVARILSASGYSGYQALYVSSQYGRLKRTGSLYRYVAQAERRPRRWLHVGDHAESDVHVAKAYGIDAYHLPNLSERYLTAQTHASFPREQLGDTLGSSLLHGIVSRKFYDQPTPPRSQYGASAYRLGYEGGGPFVLSFVLWLREKAQRAQLTDLYFLARDGYLPKQVFERVSTHRPEPLKLHYLYASRRALSVPNLRSARDVISALPSSGLMTLTQVFRDRFGVDPATISLRALRSAGYRAWDERIDLKRLTERRKLSEFVRAHAAHIVQNAAEERAAMQLYLESVGLCDASRRCGLVDIGHHASLQFALSTLLERCDLQGYYFATFEPARTVYLEGLDIHSYLLEFEDATRSEHVYAANVRLFEFLFLPALPSLERMVSTPEGKVEPKFVERVEAERCAVIAEVHRGVLDFCDDVLRAVGGDASLFSVSKNEALRSFARFARAPDAADARLLEGVFFADLFTGAERNYLIAPTRFRSQRVSDLAGQRARSLWGAGADALSARQPRRRKAASRSMWMRKARKLLRDPRRFLRDSTLWRALGRTKFSDG